MKIEEQTRVEIQQALGYAPPSPSDPGFAAFYSRLETEHPQLASQLLAGLQHEEGEGGTDSQAFFPEQEAQARTRAQARSVLQRLFYRQDHLTDEWTVSKGKVGMAGLFGACLLLGPMLLAGAGNSGTSGQVAQTPPPVVQSPAPLPVAAPAPEPEPAEAPLAAVPDAPPPDDLPPLADTPVADTAVADAPLPEVSAPPVTEAPPVPIELPRDDPAPVPAPAAPPPPPGGTVYKVARSTAATSSTVYLASSRTGGDTASGGAGKGSATSDMSLFSEPEDVNAGLPISLFGDDEPKTEPGPVASAAAPKPPIKTSADYLLGTSLKAELSTGLIATQGRGAMPVLAKSETGEIFSGLAVLSGAGRVEISFTSVLIGGELKTVNARAYDPSGLPGLTVKTRDVAPSLAADLSRAAASGVAGYVEQLGDQTQTVIEGKTTTITTQPPKLSTIIGGAIARLFSTPPTQKALERIAQVNRGTPLLITVMGEAPVPASKSKAADAEASETP